MDGRSAGAIARLSKTLVTENNDKHVKYLKLDDSSKGVIKAGTLQDRSFQKDLGKMIIFNSNCKNVAFDNSVGECDETTWTPANDEYSALWNLTSHCCSKNYQDVNLASHLIPVPECDAGSKSLVVTPNVTLATDPAVVVGHEII